MRYLIFLFVIIISCGPLGDCKEYAEACKNDECLLIVEKIPSDTDDRFDYRGTNPITKKKYDSNSYTSDMWWATYKDHIKIGDTIIKRKGELTFNIHKKDIILSFNFECQGKVYK